MRSHLNEEKLGMVASTCHTSDGGKHEIGGFWSRLACSKSKTISQITRAERAGGMAQVVEHLPSKLEALKP
jgi:hypothetical protein